MVVDEEEVGQLTLLAGIASKPRSETNHAWFANNARLVGRGGYQQRDMGPPSTVVEMGKFIHACEGEMVCESTNPRVPMFGAFMYLENKVMSPVPLLAPSPLRRSSN